MNRAFYSHHDDVLHLHWEWAEIKSEFQITLLNGDYAFDPVEVVYCAGKHILIWPAGDALVLKTEVLLLNWRLALFMLFILLFLPISSISLS